jgi:WXXGXW repeat (2 copies)
MRNYLPLMAFAALTTLAPASPAAADTRVYVRVNPPRAIVETRGVRPSRQHVWIAGFHRWDGRAYAWVPGRWDLPPAGNRRYSNGHWARDRHNGYYWVDGRWRR